MINVKRLLVGKHKQKGAVLILTLVMLAVVMAIIPALVSVMITGAKTGTQYEGMNSELYTADAGVQDAIQTIITNLEAGTAVSTEPYLLSEKYGPDINGRDAQVTISTYTVDGIQYYKIFSEGQTPPDEETTITAFINAFDAYGWAFSENAYTSPEPLDFMSGHSGIIYGGAQLPQGYTGQGEILCGDPEGCGEGCTICENCVCRDPILGWPDRSFFTEFYAPQVSAAGDISDIIDIDDGEITIDENDTEFSIPGSTSELGSINQEGNLIINPHGDGSLTLSDPGGDAKTVWYIHGDLIINRVDTNGTFNFNLNGQTVFVEGSIIQETNSGNKVVQFVGPGVVIALGDISFAPAAAYDSEGEPDPEQYIYIASIEGSVDIWPRGAFVGSILAREASTIHPSTELYFLESPTFGTLNLPYSTSTGHEIVISGIESWIIDDPESNSGIKITPYWLRPGEIGYGYDFKYDLPSRTLQALGGTTPYTWEIPNGGLPADLSLDTNTGVISGTMNETGKFYFTVQATDNEGKIGKQIIVMTVNDLPSIEMTEPLPQGQVGVLYSEFIPWTGGTPTFTWSVTSGQLPPGLELLSSTGNIVGTPEVAAAGKTYSFRATLTDSYDATDWFDLSITIAALP
jgi:hypothetical protein